jgi:predicted GNAT family N-acyltransferase
MDGIVEAPGTAANVGPVARLAVTRDDRLAAFRLRYEVYIAEQRKGYVEVDHDERLFCDELDDQCDLIVVEKANSTVGTGRTSWFDTKPTLNRYAQVFELEKFLLLVEPEKICVCSRLAVLPTERDSQIRSRLFEFIYQNALKRDTRFCFLTCAPLLVRMFRKYGFREYGPPVMDPVVGVLHRELLVLDDLVQLQRVRSPFWEVAKNNGLTHSLRPWLDQLFQNHEKGPHAPN